MKKKLIIRDRNKFLYYKNRKVRTPVTLFDIDETDLIGLRTALKMSDIQDFSIEEIKVEKLKSEIDVVIDIPDNKEVVIEELDIESSEPKTILEKLMNGEK